MSARGCVPWLMLTLCLAGAVGAQQPGATPAYTGAWPDNFLSRLEALALLQTLNAQLLSHDSATLTLEHWCEAHHLATPARITAQRVSGVDKPPGDEQRAALQVSATQLVRYRRVRLLCGNVELSDADNWYVPERLTAQMNAQLDSSDIPFGKVVHDLNFHRHTVSSTLLWWPLPADWETGAPLPPMGTRSGTSSLYVPPAVLEQRAVLSLPDGTPFSTVVETYRGEVLHFAPLTSP